MELWVSVAWTPFFLFGFLSPRDRASSMEAHRLRPWANFFSFWGVWGWFSWLQENSLLRGKLLVFTLLSVTEAGGLEASVPARRRPGASLSRLTWWSFNHSSWSASSIPASSSFTKSSVSIPSEEAETWNKKAWNYYFFKLKRHSLLFNHFKLVF